MIQSTTKPPLQHLCRDLTERSPQPMVAVEGTTHIVVYVNPAFLRLVGKNVEELIGRPFAEAVPEGKENGCCELLDRVFRTGHPEVVNEQEHRQANPRSVYWSYSMWPMLGPDERPTGVMIQVSDITETALFRRQAQAMNEALLVSGLKLHEQTEVEKLLTAELRAAVQTRDHFLAVLSHELRNPLTAFNTGLLLLDHAGSEPGRAKWTREMMGRQLVQMVRLVDDLLDISRIASGKVVLRRQSVELAMVLRDAVEASRPLIDGGGHELTVDLPPEPILLSADPTRLAQVFLNLLNNAAKYSEPGGRIRLSATRAGDEIAVSIRDTGIGIAAAALPKIFDAFMQVDTSWQRAQGGMGIGLSLVKEFVELHGGRVEARSGGLGAGSEFLVHLPIAIRPVSESPVALPAETSARPRRILVVDDNRDAAESLALMLELMGHDVRSAYDGEAGVAVATEFRPEIILMDLGMPKLNGYEAARWIRSETWGNDPFLVALTGWGTDDDRTRTREAGFDQHLVKPVNVDSLSRALAAAKSTHLQSESAYRPHLSPV